MVDGIGLENRRTREGLGGSNPSLSAILRCVILILLDIRTMKYSCKGLIIVAIRCKGTARVGESAQFRLPFPT